MLSRKDYIGLCDAIAEGVVTGKFLDALTVFLKQDNPRFDQEKFVGFLHRIIESKRAIAKEEVF